MKTIRIALAAAALVVLVARAPAEGLPQKAYEVVKLSDGVYAFVWKDPIENLIESNSLFVINDHDVLVVDTGMVPSTARVMAAELRKLTDRPVRYVVTTHWHDDHHGGNEVYRDLWPGVEFIAHRDTREDILAQTYAPRPKEIADLEEQAKKYGKWAETGKDDDGKPLEESRRRRAAEIAALDRALAPEVRAMRETPPDFTFTDRLVLHRAAGRSRSSGSAAATRAATSWSFCRRSGSPRRATSSCSRCPSASVPTTRSGWRRSGGSMRSRPTCWFPAMDSSSATGRTCGRSRR